MAHAYADRDDGNDFLADNILCAAIFVPCFIVWTIGVICMLPITILAFPAQYLFEHKPKLHGDIVTGLIIIGASNALFTPLIMLYSIYW
jgi:hypothetical protein